MALRKSESDPLEVSLKNIIDQFKEPLDPKTQIEYRAIQWGKGDTVAMPFAYLNARAVMDRLDEVTGGEWLLATDAVPSAFQNEKVCVKATITIHIDGQYYSRSGFGEEDLRFAKDSDRIVNDPWKSAESDAIKRAAIAWGIGRYLYDCPKVWMKWEGDKYYGHFAEDPSTKLFDGDGYPLPKSDPFDGGEDDTKDSGRTRRSSSRGSTRKEEADEEDEKGSAPSRTRSSGRTSARTSGATDRKAPRQSSSKIPEWLDELTGCSSVDEAVDYIIGEIEASGIAPLPTDKQVKFALDLAIREDKPLGEEVFEYSMSDFGDLLKELQGKTITKRR